MLIRKANSNDINSLIKLRLDYLIADRGSLTMEEESAVRAQLAKFFPEHINRDFIAMMAEIDHLVVSVAFLVIAEKPANPAFITGKTGTLLNVLTYPEFRQRGIATRVISEIIEEAKKLEVSSIDLSSTPDGKPLYEKLGFIEPKSKYTRMELQLV
jgi:ribosomal protein S18 acetylase RimI-like enzyme